MWASVSEALKRSERCFRSVIFHGLAFLTGLCMEGMETAVCIAWCCTRLSEELERAGSTGRV